MPKITFYQYATFTNIQTRKTKVLRKITTETNIFIFIITLTINLKNNKVKLFFQKNCFVEKNLTI